MSNDGIYNTINRTQADFPKLALHEIVARQCESTPEAVAVLCDNQNQTYRQLHKKSNQLANHLITLGVGKGDLVGLCCNRDIDLPAHLLGILKTGAGYVPLDPDYPQERLEYMAGNSGLTHVVAHAVRVPLIESFNTNNIVVDEQEAEITAASTSTPDVKTVPMTDVAYVIYTSGSTGKPKGVLVHHAAAVNMLFGLKNWPGFESNDRILATTTLSFDISVVEVFLPLVCGGSVAIVDRETARDSVRLVESIERHKITVMQATPSMWRMILDADFRGNSKMKFFTGGEPLPRDLIQPMLDACGELWNLYGPTETAVYSTGTRILNDRDRILIGRPVANTNVYIVNKENQLCGMETPGELLIGGAGVALGYLNRDELTTENFVNFNGERVYRTGDLAQLTESGQIEHLGRIDGQIKLNGHRIELGEIDMAMAASHNVRHAAAVLREDRPGDKRLVGYLLAQLGCSVNVSQVREKISKSLPLFMVPDIIVVVDDFPYTPSGKLDRKSFAPPSTERPNIGSEYVAPTTEMEKHLATIWKDVLQLDSIGTEDNFFDFGGNSIRALRVVDQARSELSIDITNAEFFDHPTIKAILGLTEKRQSLSTKVKNTAGIRNGLGEYAIVGMAAKMPGATNVSEFWNNLVSGEESIQFFSKEELDLSLDPRQTRDPNYVAARGTIEDADCFDARFFYIMPRAAELIDPQHRIMLELAWTALEDAGIMPDEHRTIGVWAGTYSTTYYLKNLLSNPELVRQTGEFQLGAYNEKDFIASRVAYCLNLNGPAVNVNTACSTSLVTLIEACKSLALRHCDIAITGGVSVHFPQKSGHLHQTGSIFTPDGHCRPFDERGGGTLFSDGGGVVVVKRLEDAVADGDRIYAVVKGFGINNDGGEKASFSAPSISGQAGAIAMAHDHAGIGADTISYVEAHGTATPVGDPIEVAALSAVFDAQTDKRQFCALGSVKSNIGHTVAAAGVAGLIKTALSLFHEQIPPTLHYRKPNPQINFEESPFYVCSELKEWSRNETARRAGVSAFGVGGTNAHVVLEEAPLTPSTVEASNFPVQIIPLSAKTESALDESIDNLVEHLNVESELKLTDVCHTLQNGRRPFPYRAMAVVGGMGEAVDVLTAKRAPQFCKRKSNMAPRDIVFMFPGQGSQYVRMGQNLYEHNHTFRVNFDRCCEILEPLLGRDLRNVLFPTDRQIVQAEEVLRATQYTQPALFSLGYSLSQVWMSWGFHPSALTGHSIGEFVAACIAGVFSLEDGLRIIAKRGELMQALPGGSMMSVRLPGSDVEPLIWGDLAIGSYNGPSLCVVSGPDAEVAELQKRLEADQILCHHLHTSHAFHSPMMDTIVEPFAEFISRFELSRPSIPILSTVSGDWLTDQQAIHSDYWADHLRQPVRFSDAVTRLWAEDPTRVLMELGPRRTLSTLSRQHAKDPKQQLALPALSDTAENNAEWIAMMNAVGQLWLAGADVNWRKISIPMGRQITLPTYPFQRKRHFVDPAPSIQRNGGEIETGPATPANTSAHDSTPAPELQPTRPQIAKPLIVSPSTGADRITSTNRRHGIVATIKSVFEHTSGIDVNEYDQETTFFEMGLDSLVLTQSSMALKKEFGVEVTFRQLLEEIPNVNLLADFLDAELPSERIVDESVTAVASPEGAVDENVVADQSAENLEGVHTSCSVESIIQRQLQLMEVQLELLSKSRQASSVGSNPAETINDPGESKKTLQQIGLENSPPPDAKLGKDRNGNPGWFVTDGLNPGRFIQITTTHSPIEANH